MIYVWVKDGKFIFIVKFFYVVKCNVDFDGFKVDIMSYRYEM